MIELCECGQNADPAIHSPLPPPLPWDHGRPCSGEVNRKFAHAPSSGQQPRIRRNNAARKFWERPITPSEYRELER